MDPAPGGEVELVDVVDPADEHFVVGDRGDALAELDEANGDHDDGREHRRAGRETLFGRGVLGRWAHPHAAIGHGRSSPKLRCIGTTIVRRGLLRSRENPDSGWRGWVTILAG